MYNTYSERERERERGRERRERGSCLLVPLQRHEETHIVRLDSDGGQDDQYGDDTGTGHRGDSHRPGGGEQAEIGGEYHLYKSIKFV